MDKDVHWACQAAIVYLTKAIKTGGIVTLTPADFELYESVDPEDSISITLDPNDERNIILALRPKRAQA